MYFFIEYFWNKCIFFVFGFLLKVFSVDVIFSGYYRGDNLFFLLLFNGKDGIFFVNISWNIIDICNVIKVFFVEE